MKIEKKYYWLKLKDDFFKNKKIKKLRKISGGDTFTIIYLKLQLLSINTEGILEYTGLEKTFEEELALDIDEDPDDIKITLNYLLSCGLMEPLTKSEYKLPEVEKNTGHESASTIRSRRYRDKQKALQCNTSATLMQRSCNTAETIVQRSCNDTQHNCNTEKEIEKDIEKDTEREIDRDSEIEKKLKKVILLFNTICISYPKCTKVNKAVLISLNQSLFNYSIDDFKKLFEKAESSDFLKGNNSQNWSASFSWLIKENNMLKVLEGKYDNKSLIAPKDANFGMFSRNYSSEDIKAIENALTR